ncbi:hypothetical protein GCM10020331_003740 [Ectobacillus funiculus]
MPPQITGGHFTTKFYKDSKETLYAYLAQIPVSYVFVHTIRLISIGIQADQRILQQPSSP